MEEFKNMIIATVVCVLIVLGMIGMFSCRMDFAGGSHRITPTSVDNDMWGNYRVYYRTSDYTKNQDEDYYYIDKSRKDLAEEIRECIKKKQELIVYYDKYVGFYGCTAPGTSPITRYEVIEED